MQTVTQVTPALVLFFCGVFRMAVVNNEKTSAIVNFVAIFIVKLPLSEIFVANFIDKFPVMEYN